MSADDPGHCVVCGSVTRPRPLGGTPVRVCVACGMGAVDDGGHTADYWAAPGRRGKGPDHYWTDARASLFGGALKLLSGEVPGRRLLDIGGGVGHFAECALDAGWDAYSYDVSQMAVSEAASRIGAGRSLAGVPDALAHSFDVVTLWCVVAHGPDPRPVLEEAVGALRSGGALFLTTPNFRFHVAYLDVLAKLGRPVHVLEHDHVLQFTATALRRVLADVGVTRCRFTYVGVTEHCVAEPRLSRLLVPAKRAWNRAAVAAARTGLPLLSSELQVVGTVG